MKAKKKPGSKGPFNAARKGAVKKSAMGGTKPKPGNPFVKPKMGGKKAKKP